MKVFGVSALLLLLLVAAITSAQSLRFRRASQYPPKKYTSSRSYPDAVVRDFPTYEPDSASPEAAVVLDRNMAIACTNRHNCEMTCAQARVAKFPTKSALLDAFTSREGSLTDAHKLGIQFGRKKSCDKCSLIYSNCGNQLYRIANEQLFAWRMTPIDTEQMISYSKSTNNL